MLNLIGHSSESHSSSSVPMLRQETGELEECSAYLSISKERVIDQLNRSVQAYFLSVLGCIQRSSEHLVCHLLAYLIGFVSVLL